MIKQKWAWTRSVQTRGYRPEAAAAFPSVIFGGPGSVFMTTVLLATELSPVRRCYTAG
jgi:hypothetical protein